MRIDYSPFYRSTVGFDHLLNLLDTSADQGYPPYNIERVESPDGLREVLRITLAVAGFTRLLGISLLVVGLIVLRVISSALKFCR